MYVGVIQAPSRGTMAFVGIPHVCGGDPLKVHPRHRLLRYSPCMWG